MRGKVRALWLLLMIVGMILLTVSTTMYILWQVLEMGYYFSTNQYLKAMRCLTVAAIICYTLAIATALGSKHKNR